jgi:pimeloyl-ACP methyl ester carboxylesterase
MAEATERLIDYDGGHLYVRDHPGRSPAIVAMHGFPDDSRIYHRLIGPLAPHRVVTFDWNGYGRSSRNESEESSAITRQPELLAVCDALQLEQAVLVGHDASGPEAIDFALDHPQRVTGLVLLNTYYGRQPNLRLPEMIALMADPALTPLTDALMSDPNQRLWLLAYTGRRFGLDDSLPPDGIGAGSIVPQFFGDNSQSDALAAIRSWTGALPAALDRQDAVIASAQLQTLQVPVSVIFGRDDPNLTPAVAQHICALFTNSEVHLINRASHWPQWDQPDEVADLIKRFIATPVEHHAAIV